MGDLTFYQWANALKGYMLALGVAFGIYMIVLWWRSSQAARRRDGEAKARSIYAAYLLRSLELQDLARPAPGDTAQPRTRAQYATFVTYLVNVADEILLLCPTKAWEDTLRAQLAPHRSLLASDAFRAGTPGLAPQTQRLVESLVATDRAAPSGVAAQAAE
jgi:hypothetical protein